MQGHHRSRRGARPRHRPAPDGSGRCGHTDGPQARLYLCANPGCRDQVLICSDCDRGHIYCADCDVILAAYCTQLQDAARKQRQTPTHRVVIPDDELPF